MSASRCGRRVTLALNYAGDSGSFIGLAATRVTNNHSGLPCITFVLDQLMSPTAPYLIGIPAVAETSEGERWNVWLCDAGLTLATAQRS